MINRSIAIAVLIASSLVALPPVSAETYTQQWNGREVVVHTNVAPVIVHRMLPPFHGKHVTERQMNAGRMPLGARR